MRTARASRPKRAAVKTLAAKREEIRAALAEIESAKGRLTPKAVVRAAANPRNPLHSHFEWDDTKAAQEHRLEQARHLIRSVEVRITTEDRVVSVVHYVRDPKAEQDQGYVSVAQLRSEPDNARALLKQEFARAVACLRRAEDLAEALGMRREVAALTRTVEATSKKLERRSGRKKAA